MLKFAKVNGFVEICPQKVCHLKESKEVSNLTLDWIIIKFLCFVKELRIRVLD